MRLNPQVNFTSLGSLIWNCYLSWVAHHAPPPHEIDDLSAANRSPPLRAKINVMSPVIRARAGVGASPEPVGRSPAKMGVLRLDENCQKEQLVAGVGGAAGTEGAGGNARVRSLAL